LAHLLHKDTAVALPLLLLVLAAIQCCNILCTKSCSVVDEILLFLPCVSLHEIQWEKSCSILVRQFNTAVTGAAAVLRLSSQFVIENLNASLKI